jgi:hypothetical protein
MSRLDASEIILPALLCHIGWNGPGSDEEPILTVTERRVAIVCALLLVVITLWVLL